MEGDGAEDHLDFFMALSIVINLRRACACAARVTVVGFVCPCVCLLRRFSPLEHLFVLKSM